MLRRVALCAALLWGSLAAANKSNTNPRNCDGLRLLFKAVPEAPTPGKSMKAAYILDNKSHQNIISSVVGITLPGSVTYTSSNSKPMGSISTLADNVVTWANGGAIKAGGSKTYMAAATVNAGAQLLTFDATAAVVLADGTTCTVEAPSSLVRAKGYKQAIPDGPENYVYPIGMRLAAADGVNGYNERIVMTRDGVDVVFACSLGGSQPSALQAVRPSDTNPNTAFAYVFVRASAGTPNPAVADWIGKCTANAIGKQYFCTNGLCDTLLTQDWCVMCQDSASKTGFGTYYCDKSNGLFTDDGGLFQLNNGFSTQTGINWTSGDQGVCYMIAEMFYKARGTDATY